MYCTIAIYCTVGVFIKKQTYVLIKDTKKPNQRNESWNRGGLEND